MQQIQFQSVGEPADVLQCVTATPPVPQHGEVLVRMLASPVNPSDLMFIRGQYTTAAHCPASPGFEGVGIVEVSGGGLRGQLFRGKRVAVLNRSGGNWAEQVVVPADQVIPLSAGLSLEAAATFFVNPATAWVMTQEVLQVQPGETLLQTAAASSLGRMIIRLGQHLGFRTINVVRRQHQADELKSLGGDDVIVFDAASQSPEELAEAVRQKNQGKGVRYAIDPVGGTVASGVVGSLAHDGHLLLFGTLSGDPIQFSPRTLMTQGARIDGFWLGNYMQKQGLLFKLKLVKRITKLIQAGVLSTEISHRFSLSDIREAVIASEDRERSGKTLLVMNS
ncbi:MAG: zinc-dependent alcohol dehydrogenase family protein [Planctomycetaceae bacterium]|nr:zinc-dependent alcohol dehydrogenase family protein [Planctomycetaceae bacterium]